MTRVLINFICFQLGWFACVISAAEGVPVVGLAMAAAAVGLHLFLARDAQAEGLLVVFAVIIGLGYDSLLVASGWIRYPSGMVIPGLAPYWILAIWALFATTLNLSMAWLRDRLWLAAALGALFGPLSYLGGGRLGGLEFLQSTAALTALSAGWAVLMPLMLMLSVRFDGTARVAEMELVSSAQRQES